MRTLPNINVILDSQCVNFARQLDRMSAAGLYRKVRQRIDGDRVSTLWVTGCRSDPTHFHMQGTMG